MSNTAKYWLAVAVGFVALFLLGYVKHDVVLATDRAALTGVIRTPLLLSWVIAGQLLFVALFTFIYRKGYEAGKAPTGQGARFGLLIGLLYWGAGSLIQYGEFQVPLALALKSLALGVVEIVILGTIVANIYRPPAEVAAPAGEQIH